MELNKLKFMVILITKVSVIIFLTADHMKTMVSFLVKIMGG